MEIARKQGCSKVHVYMHSLNVNWSGIIIPSNILVAGADRRHCYSTGCEAIGKCGSGQRTDASPGHCEIPA